MATETLTLEERMAAIEGEVALLKEQIKGNAAPTGNPWIDYVYGSFADSEGFEEAVRLGREYRESQRMEYDEEAN